MCYGLRDGRAACAHHVARSVLTILPLLLYNCTATHPITHPTLQNSVFQAVRPSTLRDSRFFNHPRCRGAYCVSRTPTQCVIRNTDGMLFSSHVPNTLPMIC